MSSFDLKSSPNVIEKSYKRLGYSAFGQNGSGTGDRHHLDDIGNKANLMQQVGQALASRQMRTVNQIGGSSRLRYTGQSV